MSKNDEHLMSSLDACDHTIMDYIPYLLQDLWELGSRPSIMVEMIEKHVENPAVMQMLDLCCGKGAVLIQLAERFRSAGVGIDLLPEFINEAKDKAIQKGVNTLLQFNLEDIVDAVEKYRDKDLVIFGYDTEILGAIGESLEKIKPCLKTDGLVLLETAFTIDGFEQEGGIVDRDALEKEIKSTGAQIIDQKVWTRDEMHKLNSDNTAKIRVRVEELKVKYPHHRDILQDFIDNQEEESAMLENEMQGITLLLKL